MQKLGTTSILLHLVLLAFCGYWFMHESIPRHPQPKAVLQRPVETSSNAAEFAGNGFHWSQIEAADYPTYIRNLRRIGCPEETILDIITADVATRDAAEGRGIQSTWNGASA